MTLHSNDDQAEVRALLSQLLSFDTTSRESNLELIHFIKTYLEELGVSSTLIFNEERTKANLLARFGPQGDGGVMLSGHTDVVPVDGQNWTFPAFELTEHEQKYYGRGSADMKGFIACVLAAVPRFAKQRLKMPVYLAFSYDEEVGCLGVRSLIEHLKSSPERPALCIIGEPTSMKPVYGHKGKVAMRCNVRGHACHSAYAPEGVNAIEYAAQIIGELSQVSEALAKHTDEQFDPPYSTIQTGVIKGGAALNIVPESCQFDMEMRYLPGVDANATFDKLEQFAKGILEPKMKAISSESNIQFEKLSAYPPLLTDKQSDLAKWVGQWADNASYETVAFGTEGGLFDEAGVATMICGPGSMDQGHKPNEFIEIDQLHRCSSMLHNLCSWLSEA